LTSKQKVYNTVKKYPYILAKQISKHTGVAYGYTRVLLAALKKEGIVESTYCTHIPRCDSYYQKIKKPHEYYLKENAQ